MKGDPQVEGQITAEVRIRRRPGSEAVIHVGRFEPPSAFLNEPVEHAEQTHRIHPAGDRHENGLADEAGLGQHRRRRMENDH